MFLFIAAVMVIVHVGAALQRPRVGVILSGIVWLLYGVYEYYILAGVLCDANCNIRADLVLFLPVLAAVTYAAWRSYQGHEGAMKVVGVALVIVGLLVATFMLEDFGFGFFAMPAVLLGALAFWLYRRRARSKSDHDRRLSATEPDHPAS